MFIDVTLYISMSITSKRLCRAPLQSTSAIDRSDKIDIVKVYAKILKVLAVSYREIMLDKSSFLIRKTKT